MLRTSAAAGLAAITLVPAPGVGGGDSLLARIEGDRGGQRRRVDCCYRRVACPGR
jgi:hypothetical protein